VAFRHAIADVRRWEAKHGRKIQVILAPQTGEFPVLREAFLAMLRDRLDSLPAGGATDVEVVVIEFFAENTDTLFSHAMFNFEGFPGFDRYQRTDYPDWTVPYTREFVVEGTRVIYNGVPVGRYNAPIVEAHFQAMDSILRRAAAPGRSARQ
jgi:hypothetical protein